MKPRHIILPVCFTLAASSLHAAPVTWDTAPGTVGPGNGTVTGGVGTWNTANGNWTTDAGANNVAWVNGNNDTAIFGGTAGAVTLGADVTVGGLTFNTNNYSIAAGAGPYTLTFGTASDINVSTGTSSILAAVAGSSTITKTGNGILRLEGVSDSFTGDVVVSGGTLQIGNNNTISRLGGATYAGNITLNGGNIRFTNDLRDTGAGPQTLSGIISGTGSFDRGGQGILTLTGPNTYTGQTKIQGSGAGGPGLSVSSFNSVNATETGAVMASSSLGAPTTVADGTILFGNPGNQRGSTLIYTGAGESTNRVMQVGFNTGAKHTISNTGDGLLQFTSNFTINPSSGNTGGGLTLSGSGDGDIAQMGTIPGILEKADGGTWTIGGTNGANSVTVTGGKLLVNGTMNVTTTVAVASGATLGGSSTVGGAITVNNGGTLSPGNSAGQFTVGSTLTLAATSNTLMELGGTTLGTSYDNISLDALATALTYGGNLSVVNLGLYDMDLTTFTYDLFDLESVTAAGSFASVTVNSILLSNSGGLWTGTNGGVNYSFAQSTGDLTITAVPEPGAALLGGLGLLTLLRRRRA